MDTPFPFGFPPDTILYLILYTLTLGIHFILAGYVLAGTAWILVSGLVSSRHGPDRLSVNLLRDWLPFALGGAITAGVAPLLFVQILYQQEFYTANLLLVRRWVMVLPALILGFYSLYLMKSRLGSPLRAWPGLIAAALATACFALTGFAWTENHLLANQGLEFWTRFYKDGGTAYIEAATLPRVGVWLSGCLTPMLAIVAWQIRYRERRAGMAQPPDETKAIGNSPAPAADITAEARTLSVVALIALTLATGFSAGYIAFLPDDVRDSVTGTCGFTWLILALCGAIVQVSGWWQIRRGSTFLGAGPRWLAIGCAMSIIGTVNVREIIRLAGVAAAGLFERHSEAAQAGGFWIFAAFLAINTALVIWVVRGVARS
jgi:hypothetical protein